MGVQKEFAFKKQDFETLSEIVYDQTGIVLKEHKFEMVYGRLARRLRSLKLDRFDQYVSIIEGNGGEEELSHLIDAITTNLTKFFREGHQFKHFADTVLKPALTRAERGGPKKLRIWSAGCSGGQEAYTIAIVIAAVIKDLSKWDIKILASDIDRNMLAKGSAGIYRADEVSNIPANFHKRFLRKQRDGSFKVVDDLRRLIRFKSLNLMRPFPFSGKFDAIFCRNVVIYFDDTTKKQLVRKFCSALEARGHLYLGHSEGMMGNVEMLEPLGRSCFQLVDDA